MPTIIALSLNRFKDSLPLRMAGLFVSTASCYLLNRLDTYFPTRLHLEFFDPSLYRALNKVVQNF